MAYSSRLYFFATVTKCTRPSCPLCSGLIPSAGNVSICKEESLISSGGNDNVQTESLQPAGAGLLTGAAEQAGRSRKDAAKDRAVPGEEPCELDEALLWANVAIAEAGVADYAQ